MTNGPQGMSDIPKAWPLPLTARALSWLAEQAEGTRGQPLVLILNERQEIELRGADEPRTDKEAEVASVYTDYRVPDRDKIETMTLTMENGPEVEVPPDWDALFWSEASIEKFFFPYYSSQRLLDDADMDALWDDYTTKELVAFAHITPSRPIEVSSTDTVGVVYVDPAQAVPTLKLVTLRKYLEERKVRFSPAVAGREGADRVPGWEPGTVVP
jgi:hypothetical protein